MKSDIAFTEEMTMSELEAALAEYSVCSTGETIPQMFQRFGIPVEHAEAAALFANELVQAERERCEALCVKEARNAKATGEWRNAATVILMAIRDERSA